MVNLIYNDKLIIRVRREILLGVEYIPEDYKSYAIIPDDLLEGILATDGWCDVEVGDDGKTAIGFTAVEIPEYARKSTEPTTDDILNALLGVE